MDRYNFKSIEENKVGMYVCGLTVYNDMHLGHARTYIAFDVIRRWLEYSGYEVNFIPYADYINDEHVLGLYKFDENGESSLQDYSDNENHGIIYGNPIWIQQE